MAKPKPHILTGGSKGFDEWVEHLCKKHQCPHMICVPPCSPRAKQITPLSQAQLNLGTAAIHRASQQLGRVVTAGLTWQYLQAYAHLINHAKQLLVFGYLDDTNPKHVKGGAGWAAQMAKDRNVLLFLFDLTHHEWMYWDSADQRYRQCEGMSDTWVSTPTLFPMTTIVGSRDTPPIVFSDLEKLFVRSFVPIFKCV